MGLRMGRIVRVCKHHGAGDDPALERGFAFVGAALLVLCQKVDVVPLERSLQLVPIKIPAQFFSFLLQHHPKINRCVAP